ncbi:serine/threonine protein kinase [Paenibacillus sp.]|uniref:serine/threonine protein kinase n=1 Tax=Paenibacillus sp. TaxID=58172 RepID=UPI002D4E8630|nr:serine/threonine protein kinase [Paenibacillus sp.]HZG58564.1 serine/threonine protein kinase [Paenibacillus sp.]
MERFAELIYEELLPGIRVESPDPHDPVVVSELPKPWKVLGRGNYAAVVVHPDYPDRVVKLYAPGREGWDEEVEVYRRLGEHEAYSRCLHADETHRFLVMKRLYGKTLYECVLQGVRIPKRVVDDIDAALAYARERGLNPHDVHGKNVMVTKDGRGVVVDVSDFLKAEPCGMWDDLKKAYYRIYLPFLHDRPVAIPSSLMNGVRKGYRFLRKGRSLWGSDS